MSFKTIDYSDGVVTMIDQRLLPQKEIYNEYRDHRGVGRAIKTMVIRGAPAIGVAAAYGMAVAARNASNFSDAKFKAALEKARDHLASQRPTAVNLFWALERMMKTADSNSKLGPAGMAKAMEKEARAIHVEDVDVCKRMGRNGAKLLPKKCTVLTHCNAGALATADYGTALGVIRAAVEAGKDVKVFADETRPFLQGARLTAWELMKDGIDVTLITDNMAGYFMKKGAVDAVVVGTDRTMANGDVANKIGTYSVAVLAKENKIPFYVAAPTSTIDLACASGDKCPIEERDPREVTHVMGKQVAPKGVKVANPAFDVTPAKYVTAIFTENGVAKAPYRKTLKEMVEKKVTRRATRSTRARRRK